MLDTDEVVEHITEEVKEGEEGEPKKKAKIVKRPVSLSDTHPLWSKSPSECTKEEYIDFYRKVFMDYKEPLFWIHLNMDYPFNLKGILYFPKDSFSSSATSSFKDSCTSASILKNLTSSCFCSR